MATRDPDVVEREPRNRQLPPRTATQRQRTGVRGSLRAGLYCSILRP
jgi:hypothetical protein